MKIILSTILCLITCSASLMAGDTGRIDNVSGFDPLIEKVPEIDVLFTNQYFDESSVIYALSMWGFAHAGEFGDDHVEWNGVREENHGLNLLSATFSLEIPARGDPCYLELNHETGSIASIFAYDVQGPTGLERVKDVSRVRVRQTDHFADIVFEDLKVVDLFGVNVSSEALNFLLNKAPNVNVLALPFLGVDFSDDRLSIPNDVEELVVYNSVVGVEFFEKLEGLHSLRRIVFYGCILDRTALRELRYSPLGNVLGVKHDVLGSLLERLETLELVRSSRSLVSYFTRWNEWLELKKLRVVFDYDYLGNGGFFRFAHDETEEREKISLRDEFPSLERIIFSIPKEDYKEETFPGFRFVREFLGEHANEIDVRLTVVGE